jgi:hypothetical protein
MSSTMQAPKPAPAVTVRQISAVQAEANWIEIALKLNASTGAKPRKAARG